MQSLEEGRFLKRTGSGNKILLAKNALLQARGVEEVYLVKYLTSAKQVVPC